MSVRLSCVFAGHLRAHYTQTHALALPGMTNLWQDGIAQELRVEYEAAMAKKRAWRRARDGKKPQSPNSEL